MPNILPIIVGAIVVGGGAIAIYNAVGGKNSSVSQSLSPAAATQAAVTAPRCHRPKTQTFMPASFEA